MLKFSTAIATFLLASGCASSPPQHGAAAASAAAPARPATPAAAPAMAAAPAKRLMSGFTLVMNGGVATYCRQDLKTGSHIVVQQRCLSQREYDSLEDDTRRDMDRIRSTISPVMGTSGGSAH